MRRRFNGSTVGLVLGVVLAFVAIGGYQVYVSEIQDRTDVRIVRSTSSCEQVGRLYGTLAQLAAGDSAFTPSQVSALWQQRTDRLTAQGCPT